MIYARAAVDWALDRRAGRRAAPDGVRVGLSEIHIAMLQRFADAQGDTVNRETPRQHQGMPSDRMAEDGLNATRHRLRRRVKRTTTLLSALQSKSRVG